MLNNAPNSSNSTSLSLITPYSNTNPTPEVVIFFEEMTKRLSEGSGPITRISYMNAALMASIKLSPDSRDALLQHIDAQPSTLLANLNVRTTNTTEPDSTFQQDLVQATGIYAIRKNILPTIKSNALPIMVGVVLPGAPPVVTTYVSRTIEFLGEFGIEMAGNYLRRIERRPTEALLSLLDNTLGRVRRLTLGVVGHTLSRVSIMLHYTPTLQNTPASEEAPQTTEPVVENPTRSRVLIFSMGWLPRAPWRNRESTPASIEEIDAQSNTLIPKSSF